jgi:hypothetical protein
MVCPSSVEAVVTSSSYQFLVALYLTNRHTTYLYGENETNHALPDVMSARIRTTTLLGYHKMAIAPYNAPEGIALD